MPRCAECENTTQFTLRVEGVETRLFDETDTLCEVETDVDAVSGYWCGECGSETIIQP